MKFRSARRAPIGPGISRSAAIWTIWGLMTRVMLIGRGLPRRSDRATPQVNRRSTRCAAWLVGSAPAWEARRTAAAYTLVTFPKRSKASPSSRWARCNCDASRLRSSSETCPHIRLPTHGSANVCLPSMNEVSREGSIGCDSLFRHSLRSRRTTSNSLAHGKDFNEPQLGRNGTVIPNSPAFADCRR